MASVSRVVIQDTADAITGVSFDVEEGDYLLDDRTDKEIWLKVVRIDPPTETAYCTVEEED